MVRLPALPGEPAGAPRRAASQIARDLLMSGHAIQLPPDDPDVPGEDYDGAFRPRDGLDYDTTDAWDIGAYEDIDGLPASRTRRISIARSWWSPWSSLWPRHCPASMA